jgi:hypothetical protein
MQIKPSINWLFAFIPVTLALDHAGLPAPWVFFSAAAAIVPIASLIVVPAALCPYHAAE